MHLINNLYKRFLGLFGSNPTERFYSLTNLFFILTILIASFASLFHVRGFWLITNDFFWATSLAFATGLGIIGSMMASRYTAWTYVSFFVIIIMELFGNVYDAFRYIDVNSANFIAWRQLIEPIFQMVYYVDEGKTIPDIIYMRWIASIQGSFIPVLVAIIFHMWMKVRKSFILYQTQKNPSQNANESLVGVNDEVNLNEQILEPLEIKFDEENNDIPIEIPIPDVISISGGTEESMSLSGDTVDNNINESENENEVTLEKKNQQK